MIVMKVYKFYKKKFIFINKKILNWQIFVVRILIKMMLLLLFGIYNM